MSSNPIVVLGARIIDGAPSPMLAERLARGLAEFQASLESSPRPSPRPIVVSGHLGEAQAMADWLVSRGVPSELVILEPEARSTNENLERAWALFPDASQLTVVTSRFHVARTRVWAWHLEIPVEVLGAPMPPGFPVKRLKNYARELIAVPHSLSRVLWRRMVRRWRDLGR